MSALATIALALLANGGGPSLGPVLELGSQDDGAAQVADDDAEFTYESLVPS